MLIIFQSDALQTLVDAGDMEELAVLVLNGDGKKLIGRKSNQPDIQAFLENVPVYMVNPYFLNKNFLI